VITSSELFNKIRINNHLSPSAKHLTYLIGSNKLLYPKLVWKEKFPNPAPMENRSGFFSYIHWLDKYWPKSSKKLKKLNAISKCPVENFGYGSRYGIVDDLTYMKSAKATVHIKDKGLVCNATIRSLALGTPVVMDRATYNNGYYDSIDGITVRWTIRGLAREINRLDNDIDYLREKSWAAQKAAEQFLYRPEHGDAFTAFLKRVA